MQKFIIGTFGVLLAVLLSASTYTVEASYDAKIEELEDHGVEIEVYLPEEDLSDVDNEEEAILYVDSDGESFFTVDEFLEFDPNPSPMTIKRIKDIHIPALNKVRKRLGKPVIIRSGARSIAHELRAGRSGKSQHVYSNGAGAVDISTKEYTEEDLTRIVFYLAEETSYTRIARYETFIHADFGKNRLVKRGYYLNTEYGWIYAGEIL